MPYPRRASLRGVTQPPARTLDETTPEDIVSLGDVLDFTGLDRKTVLNAIHRGRLPAWWPGNNPQVGFRMFRRDVEAWFFSDPSRAYTPGTGSPEGPTR